MKIKCDYCGAYINDTDEVCENCGAHNQHLVRNAKAAPKTIEELKEWYVAHNLPDENVTRFFIGKDYKGARAFGIYKDELSGNFIVYKNKDTGARAIRYEGKDEAYAVNELYLKLKEEIVNQKRVNVERRQNIYTKPRNPDTSSIQQFIIVMVLLTMFFGFCGLSMYFDAHTPNRGYYQYDSNYYYYQNGYWYWYNNSDWEKTTAPSDLSENYKDHYESSTYSSSYDIDDFSDSSYYIAPSSSSSGSSWDSDSSWDSGSSWDSSDSWDSGSTDWGSDWLKVMF